MDNINFRDKVAAKNDEISKLINMPRSNICKECHIKFVDKRLTNLSNYVSDMHFARFLIF